MVKASEKRRYIVFVRNYAGSEFAFGFASATDGGQVADLARETPGLVLSRVVERKRAA